MKLNLLPQTVSKGRALKTAWFLGSAMMIGSFVIAILLSLSAHAALKIAEAKVDEDKQPAADAVTTAAAADTVVSTAADVIRDANLAKAMIDHNDAYPSLYRQVLPYVPSFFRLTSISAAPVDATTSTITMVGTVGSYEQYSDVILALMRDKSATSISRSGYNYDPKIVPGLTPTDPIGTPRKQGAEPIPSDQLDRLTYYEEQGRSSGTTGYLDTGNYGSTESGGSNGVAGGDVKGPMPGQSEITIVLTVNKDLQAPDPLATLSAAGGAAASASTSGTVGVPPGMGPGGMGPGGLGPGGPRMPGGPGAAGGAGDRGKGVSGGD
jgi:hypothetical protein